MPFLPPSLEDRIKVLEIYLNKARMGHTITPEQLVDVGRRTEGYTQAEIEGVIVKTVELSTRKRGGAITIDDLELALKYTSKTSSSSIQEMTDIAIKECNDLEFLPKEYQTN